MVTEVERRMIRVLDHIHACPAGDMSLDALAQVAALSRFHFHRVFHAVTGETAAQAVRRVRLYRASVDLVGGVAPVAAIARSVGYPSLPSFARAFAAAYGLPPAAFRKRGQAAPAGPVPARADGSGAPGVQLRTLPQQRLAALPHRGSYLQIGGTFAKLLAILSARKLADGAGMIGLYHDDPAALPKADLSSHAAIALPSGDIRPPLQQIVLPAGLVAVLRHVGPYAGLPAAYDQLYRQWLPGSGYLPADVPVSEVYLNAPATTPPDHLITDLCLPVVPA